MNRYLAPLVALLATLLALILAAKPVVAAASWPDTWPGTLLALALALLAARFWRRQPQPLWAEQENFAEESGPLALQPREGLQQCILALQSLLEAMPALPLSAVLQQLEQIDSQWVIPLAHAQHRLQARSGQGISRQQMASFAGGELWFNRARSTAGDRYRQETREAIAQALLQFRQLQHELEPDTSR
ncbi:MAG: hypothetical protein HQM06_03195 [Magnetococcales bacterium]|nr:hypothetical protein [Magnetococcales bacterium]